MNKGSSSTQGKVTVLIADSHRKYREALRQVLELEDDIQVVLDTGEWSELYEAAGKLKPDVILLDIRLPAMDGVRSILYATEQLLEAYPKAAVIVLSMFEGKEMCIRAHRAGARAYFQKDGDPRELVSAAKMIARSGGLPDRTHCDNLLDKSMCRLHFRYEWPAPVPGQAGYAS